MADDWATGPQPANVATGLAKIGCGGAQPTLFCSLLGNRPHRHSNAGVCFWVAALDDVRPCFTVKRDSTTTTIRPAGVGGSATIQAARDELSSPPVCSISQWQRHRGGEPDEFSGLTSAFGLVEDVQQVSLDSAEGDAERPGHVRLRLAFGDQLEDARFRWRQIVKQC